MWTILLLATLVVVFGWAGYQGMKTTVHRMCSEALGVFTRDTAYMEETTDRIDSLQGQLDELEERVNWIGDHLPTVAGQQ